MEGVETLKRISAMAGDAAACLSQRFLARRVAAFGKEFVGIAYQFLLYAKRKHIADRKRQPQLLYINGSQSGARMTLAHKGMERQSLGFQHPSPLHPMAEIRQRSVAMYARSIAVQNADVVQQRRLLHKRNVGIRASLRRTFQSFAGHGAAVRQEELAQFRLSGIISIDYFNRIHLQSVASAAPRQYLRDAAEKTKGDVPGQKESDTPPL